MACRWPRMGACDVISKASLFLRACLFAAPGFLRFEELSLDHVSSAPSLRLPLQRNSRHAPGLMLSRWGCDISAPGARDHAVLACCVAVVARARLLHPSPPEDVRDVVTPVAKRLQEARPLMTQVPPRLKSVRRSG